jgi:hypothetical protein
MRHKQQHRRHRTLLLAILFVASLFIYAFSSTQNNVQAEDSTRTAKISVSFTSYEWWLLTWSHSQVVCQVFVEHEALPSNEEIQYYCGNQVLRDWMNTKPCIFADQITKAEHCPGFYLHLANVSSGEREIDVTLMPPEVYVDITECQPEGPDNYCTTLPKLFLTAEEPLPNEKIISVQGYLGQEPFSCEGAQCTVPLQPTGTEGIDVSFWAESSFGDASETYTAQIRVTPWGDFAAPDVPTNDDPRWYVDIISSQYLGEIDSSCSQIWSAFPPVGGPPQWLSSPEHPEALITDQPYYYLAGNFITEGMVDVSTCPNGGLETAGVANQCGLEAARPLINEWQNQFDAEIIRVADKSGVPAQLIKNMFSRESQFWPGLSSTYQEAGLGHLSDLGADTVLLWNPSFYNQFCPLVLDSSVCQGGFGNLDLAYQEMLRGALVQKVNAACPECPQGIDLSEANYSISIFASSLLANCEQVGQIVYNETGRTPGEEATYDDLWRFTLINYNAGSGCLTNAIQETRSQRLSLTWENVSQFLEPGACSASIDYVTDISNNIETPQPSENLEP